MFVQQLLRAGILPGNHVLHPLVNQLCGPFAVRPVEHIFFATVVVAQVRQLLAHARIGNHPVGLLRHALQVVHGPRGDMADEQFLGSPSAQRGAHLVQHLLLRGNLPFFGQVPGSSQGPSARHDGHLDQRVGMFQKPRDGGMARLVQGDGPLLVGRHHLGLLLQSAHNAVDGRQEILLAHCRLSVAGRNQSRLVAHVGDVRPAESRSLPGQQVYIHRLVQLQRTQVHAEYLLALVQVGQVYVDLPVEPSGPQQRLVEDVHPVGGCQDNDPAVRAESVHLRQQLVQRTFALVVAAHAGVLSAGPAHGVYFVDEDNAGSLLLRLAEQVAHARCAHPHEHLHEVRARHGEEGYVRFAGHRLGQQCLTGSRRAHQQGTLGDFSAQFGIFLRLLQEVYNLLHLLLGGRLPCHVLERDFGRPLLEELRTAFPHAEHVVRRSGTCRSAHPPHDEHPQSHQ